jgi:DnaJ-class molecular chaperone
MQIPRIHCEKCDGSGRVAGIRCEQCHGHGYYVPNKGTLKDSAPLLLGSDT